MDVHCPECGSTDIDLAEMGGFECQECGCPISDDTLTELMNEDWG